MCFALSFSWKDYETIEFHLSTDGQTYLPFFPCSCLQLYPDGGLESLDCARQQVYSLWLKNHIEQGPALGTSFLDHENSWRMDKMRIFISVDLRTFWEDQSILFPPSLAPPLK